MKSDNINVVVFTHDFPAGMAGTKRVQHLLEYLLVKKISINVISFRTKKEQPAIKGTFHGVPYINIGYMLDFKLWNLHKVFAYFVKGLCLISKFKDKNSSNIVYSYGGLDLERFIFVSWAKLLGFRLLFDIVEDYAFFEDKAKLLSKFKFWTVKKMDFLTFQWASAIIVVSTYLLNKYSARNNRRVVLIPITSKPNYNENKRMFNDPLQIVYAGTFDKKDGVSDIIEGFNTFTAIYQNAILILTGKSEQQSIYEEKYKNYKNIVFKGCIPDEEFYDLLKNSDILCMCRTNSGFASAGFPFKLGEYLATGNPVIATKVSDVEQYLTSDDVYLIEPNNPSQISNVLIEIIENPEKAKKVGLNGLKKCQKFFSPETNGEMLYDLLKTI